MINQYTLEIALKFGCIDNKHMQVHIIYNDSLVEIVPDQNNTALVKVPVKTPDSVVLKFSGKDLNCDTKLDEKGNIVADLYVEFTAISLSGFEIPTIRLHKMINLITVDNQNIQTNYIGFNGTVQIDLPKNSIFSQVMSWRRDPI